MKSIYKTKCPHCEKVVKTRPAGGDWLNAIYRVNHKDPITGERCEGTYRKIDEEKLIRIPEGGK